MVDWSRYASNAYNHLRYTWTIINIINSVAEFNEILDELRDYPRLNLTKNGHLKKERWPHNGMIYIETPSRNSIEYLVVWRGRIYRFVYSAIINKDAAITGMDAFKEFKAACAEELKPYAVTSNADVAAVKQTIEKPLIELSPMGRMLQNFEIKADVNKKIYHIDINSAYPAGLCYYHPEFKPFFLKHYELRHQDKIHKAILNYSIGCCQSLKIIGKRFPLLAKDAISWTKHKLLDLSEKLRANGDTIIAYNTDGIWFYGPEYHDEDEGTELGQWKCDHVAEKIRFKSAGSYEFMENGAYHPVVRGHTTRDDEKPRSEWTWGDIYNCGEINKIGLLDDKLYIIRSNEAYEKEENEDF